MQPADGCAAAVGPVALQRDCGALEQTAGPAQPCQGDCCYCNSLHKSCLEQPHWAETTTLVPNDHLRLAATVCHCCYHVLPCVLLLMLVLLPLWTLTWMIHPQVFESLTSSEQLGLMSAMGSYHSDGLFLVIMLQFAAGLHCVHDPPPHRSLSH
jgi:hypothetical protein